MSPRLPAKPKTPSLKLPETHSLGLPDTPTASAGRIPSVDSLRSQSLEGPPGSSGQVYASHSRPAPDSPRIQVTEVADQASIGDRSLQSYRVAATNALPPANPQGFRIIKKRSYVDLEEGGTVMVVYDAQLEAYRAKRSHELLPSGPALYRIDNGTLWGRNPGTSSEGPPPAKQPRLLDDPTPDATPKPTDEPLRVTPPAATPGQIVPKYNYLAQSSYARLGGPDSQGYYRLKNLAALADSSDLPLFAFSQNDHWVLTTPPTGRLDASGQSLAAEHLSAWTDRDIWEHYRIHGNDITRFRADAATTGLKPQWANATSEGRPREQLIRELKWVHPEKSPEERAEILRSYNLLPSMLPPLKQAIQEHGKLPDWAETHKLQSMNETDPQRFDLLEHEVAPQIRQIRNFEPHSLDPDFDAYFTRPFLEAFLLKIGYQRNIHGCLYRTDIPALFRSEDRTPFELARDGCMLAREGHPPGSTTEKALSVTFSLSDAKGYGVGGGPGIGQLRYNTQTNKYPGRRPESDSASQADTDSEGSDHETSSNASQAALSHISGTSSQAASGGETASALSGTPRSLDSERGYATYRHRQTTRFIYMIDTRNLEVVPGPENRFFNRDAEGASFPYDDIEGHISVSSRGISADRIWLINSGLTRAANVRAIQAAAGQTSADIESATWSGTDNSHVYDQLIDQVADSGGVVINWPADGKIFADDVVWPPAKT
ncbi:hypothetical protein HX866_24235 [Pseudomonas gingeri]|uniref:hypothetical protein n=1 Tax=Pseudomonas gingeri TaxID=117681 RepID=UPI0015A046FD|nr:hypothetical protein [Pseudomonas gingeri]NWA28005.1 hypothetical protein [Pseudomonas gingeri]